MNHFDDFSLRRKIAVMGGTFDPVHYGHLVAAEAVRDRFQLDKVIFIPAGNPPHKNNHNISDSNHRYNMTLLATATNPYFEVSRIELDRKGVSYTIDTIKELISIYGSETELFFITGADALLDILAWHKVEELLKLCYFVAATRPGFNNMDLEQKLYEIKSKYGKEIFNIEIPSLAISSTDIRSRVQNNHTIKYLLPEAVEQYIMKHGIYRE
ncbi:MAG: nicotinate-nucleotide adenylyltransferase [Bacillota bacterium]